MKGLETELISLDMIDTEIWNIPLPFTTAGGFLTLGVADGRWYPLTVLLVIPLLRLLSV